MSHPSPNAVTTVVDVTPELMEQWINEGIAMLLDVREDPEVAAERIPGADHEALSRFDPAAVRQRHGQQRVVFQCRSGKRSVDAALLFREQNEHVFHLAGGIEGWKASGRIVER